MCAVGLRQRHLDQRNAEAVPGIVNQPTMGKDFELEVGLVRVCNLLELAGALWAHMNFLDQDEEIGLVRGEISFRSGGGRGPQAAGLGSDEQDEANDQTYRGRDEAEGSSTEDAHQGAAAKNGQPDPSTLCHVDPERKPNTDAIAIPKALRTKESGELRLQN